MTLQHRVALLAAGAVAVAILLASVVVYAVVRGELRGRLDDELRATAATRVPLVAGRVIERGGMGFEGPSGPPGPRVLPPPLGRGAPGLAPPRDALGLPTAYVAVIDAGGEVVLPADARARLPVNAAARAVAAGGHAAFLADAHVGATAVRVLTQPVPGAPGYALQIARPLGEVDRTLHRLAMVLVLVSGGGIALAAVLGRFVARTAAQREVAVERQRQLVADASHELRTPLTSLRTNVEVLARANGGRDGERARLIGDVVEQLAELSALVGDVVELARDEEPAAELEDVRFDGLVEAAVERARRRPQAPVFVARLEPCIVRGAPGRLDRAVSNLLENAAKWSPPGGEVTVTLRGGELTVRDRGPGIPPEDLPHVFERFYRAPDARGMPGSGLGLAIVRQVAELHGGRVEARNVDEGGALLRLVLPAEPADTLTPDVPLVDTEHV